MSGFINLKKEKKAVLQNAPEDVWKGGSVGAARFVEINVQKLKCTLSISGIRVFIFS